MTDQQRQEVLERLYETVTKARSKRREQVIQSMQPPCVIIYPQVLGRCGVLAVTADGTVVCDHLAKTNREARKVAAGISVGVLPNPPEVQDLVNGIVDDEFAFLSDLTASVKKDGDDL